MKPAEPRVVAITGAAGGLGRAYALRLATKGWHVALIDIDDAGVQRVASELRDAGHAASAFPSDLTQQNRVVDTFAQIQASAGAPRALINNAGGVTFKPGPMEHIAAEDWMRAIAVNLTSTWYCCQAVIPGMKAGRAGTIVNVSTTIVSKGYPTLLTPYVVAKGGVVALTRALSRELGPYGITVNAVAPGVVPHKFNPNAQSTDAFRHFVESVVRRQALERPGVPNDLTGVVDFLTSSDAGFMTGQVLNVDGGWALA